NNVVAGNYIGIDVNGHTQIPGIVSWWKAEGSGGVTAPDSVDSNPGTLTNGATYASGKVGQAFSLDGVDDFVQVADAANLRPAQVTLEAWVKPSRSGVFSGIVTKEPTSTSTLDGYGFRQR